MKKILSALLLLCLMFSLCSCEGQTSTDEQFMNSLAKGLEARWALCNTDEGKDTITQDDWAEYFDAELKEISQYENKEFENADLGKWAKKYIESMKASVDCLDYYNTAQWDSKYHSDIYQDRAEAVYRINSISAIPVSEDYKTDLKGLVINGEVSMKTSEWMKKIKFEKVEDEYGYATYRAILENTSSTDFDYFDFTIGLVDKDGVTIDTVESYVENWNSGEKARFEFTADEPFEKKVIKYASWDF